MKILQFMRRTKSRHADDKAVDDFTRVVAARRTLRIRVSSVRLMTLKKVPIPPESGDNSAASNP